MIGLIGIDAASTTRFPVAGTVLLGRRPEVNGKLFSRVERSYSEFITKMKLERCQRVSSRYMVRRGYHLSSCHCAEDVVVLIDPPEELPCVTAIHNYYLSKVHSLSSRS